MHYIHNLDPIALSIGPIQIHWYGVSCVVAIYLGWMGGYLLLKRDQYQVMSAQQWDSLVTWIVVGIIFGGRIGDILFYSPTQLWKVWEYLYIWEPGRSFHGSLIGCIIAILWFCNKNKISFWATCDIIVTLCPLGLFLGRIANFINAELWGRPSNVAWAVIFPYVDKLPRHPSQIYEAFSEGLLLFVVLYALSHTKIAQQKSGLLTSVFLIGYGLCRIVIELFREPDIHLGFFYDYFTMGQILSLPLLVFGIYKLIALLRK